jgi:YD repeat-containing protein
VNGQPQTQTTGYKYDGNNRLTETDYPDGTKTQTQYNTIGKQSAEPYPRSGNRSGQLD